MRFVLWYIGFYISACTFKIAYPQILQIQSKQDKIQYDNDSNFVKQILLCPPRTYEDIRDSLKHKLTDDEKAVIFNMVTAKETNPDIQWRSAILVMMLYKNDSIMHSKIPSKVRSKIAIRWMMQIADDMRLWCYPKVKESTTHKEHIVLNTTQWFNWIKNIGICCIFDLTTYLDDRQRLIYPGVNGEMATIANYLQLQKRDFAYIAIKKLLHQEAKLAYDRKERDEQIVLLKRELNTTVIDCK